MKRKIKTTMDDLIMAFEMNTNEYSQYLNLETGGIAIISELGDSFDENGNEIDWDDMDKFDDLNKYIPVPGSDPHEAFEIMERFTKTVQNRELQQKLCHAMSMNRPFYHFRNILLDYPEEQKRWFSFQEQATRKQILDWLEQNNLELEKY